MGGKYSSGKSFPSSTALARRFEIARFTIRQALDILAKEGLIRSQRGRGTFVTKMGANRQIGLIVPGVAYSEFFQPIVTALSGVCTANGYGLSIGSVFSANGEERARQAMTLARDLAEQHVSGVILQPIETIPNAPSVNKQILAVFKSAGIPVVLLDSDIVPPPDRSEYDLVGIDNYDAGRRLARHVLGCGVRKLCFMSHPNSCNSIEARWLGILLETSLWKDAKVWRVDCEPRDSACICQNFMRKRPEAIICGYDTFAAYVKCAIEKLEIARSSDVLLAGFDDLQDAVLMTPTLTTIHQPCLEIAHEAFYALLDRVRDPDHPPRKILMSAPLVVRASTRRVKLEKKGERKTAKRRTGK